MGPRRRRTAGADQPTQGSVGDGRRELKPMLAKLISAEAVEDEIKAQQIALARL